MGSESSRTRWTLGTWDASTTALSPRSVSSGLPDGTVAIPIGEPADALETEVIWLGENQSPTVAAFVEVAGGVFAASPA